MPPDKNKGELSFENKKDDDKQFAEEGMSNAELARQLRDVQNQLAVTRAGMPLSLIPEHGAGPGMEVNETWSQAEQEELSVTIPPH